MLIQITYAVFSQSIMTTLLWKLLSEISQSIFWLPNWNYFTSKKKTVKKCVFRANSLFTILKKNIKINLHLLLWLEEWFKPFLTFLEFFIWKWKKFKFHAINGNEQRYKNEIKKVCLSTCRYFHRKNKYLRVP